jgi:hypothetical protein
MTNKKQNPTPKPNSHNLTLTPSEKVTSGVLHNYFSFSKGRMLIHMLLTQEEATATSMNEYFKTTLSI